LRLANALIARQGVELPLGGTDIFLPSFLVDMESLFEEYLIRVLQQHLSEFQVVSGCSVTKRLFDDMETPTANPDAILLSQNKPIAVGDVKYKPRYSREDLNQVIAYALSYRVSIAVLFLPALTEAEAGLGKAGEISGISVYHYRLWLGSVDLVAAGQQMAVSLRTAVPANAYATAK
jgi:5-methylcytosine-specific restriction endonuclease McrBC regulatory subunit McrC